MSKPDEPAPELPREVSWRDAFSLKKERRQAEGAKRKGQREQALDELQAKRAELQEERWERKGKTAKARVSPGAGFAGVSLTDGRVSSPQGGGSVAGAHATVDTAGQLSRRMTATRLVLTGPLALAWRKKKDDREVYLLIEGQGWAISAPVDPKRGAQARDFAAKINAAASAAGASAPPAETPAPDVYDQLQKLADLRDAGVLSPAEFNTKKADLMKRI